MPSGWRIGATQLKHAPKPHAMWFSSETSQGISKASTRRARAASMGEGPQPTIRAGRSPCFSRRAKSSVTNPRCPAEPSSVAISTSIPTWRKSLTPASNAAVRTP